jgi:hypothetical protein
MYKRFQTRNVYKTADENSTQDRQCTYNVTPRRVRVTIVIVEKQEVLHIVGVCL